MVAKTRTWNSYLPGSATQELDLFDSVCAHTNTVSYTPITTVPTLLEWKRRDWNTQVGWKAKRKSQGYLDTLQMVETRVTWKHNVTSPTFGVPSGGCYSHVMSTNGCQVHISVTQSSNSPPGGITTDMRNEVMSDAQHRALAKARDMKVNIPVLFAEGRQTVRMIRESANTLYRAYRAFRRGRFSKASEILGITSGKGAGNHWLQYSYGWMPLLSDAKGLAELAAQQLELHGRPPRFTARGRSRREYPYLWNTQNSGMVVGVISDRSEVGTMSVEGNAGLLLEVEYTTAALAAQTGMAVTDPALVAWELIPFSFVFDWFIDVGTWLESASALSGLSVKTGYWSTTVDHNARSTVTRVLPPYVLIGGTLPSCEWKYRRYGRSLWMGSTPKLQVKVADALNARRLVTSAALWRQRLRDDRLPGKYSP